MHGIYKFNSETKFKITMLKVKLRNYSDAYVLLKATITVARKGADASGIETDKNSWQVIFENCAITK